MKSEAITKWAEELTGKNSVIPWIIANAITGKKYINLMKNRMLLPVCQIKVG